MASKQTKRPAKTNDKGSRSSKSKNQDTKNSERANESIRDEVILIVTGLLSLLLLLSNFNLSGPLGQLLKKFNFGMMGYFAHVFPFVLFFMVAFTLSNRGSILARRKIIGSIVFLFALTSLIQMIDGYDKALGFFSYFSEAATNYNGGGLIGGTLISILCPLFGVMATVIILIVLLLLCIIFITGKAILTLITRKWEQKLSLHKRQRELNAEEYKQLDLDDEIYTETKRKPRIVTFQKQGEEVKKSLFGEVDKEDDDLFAEEDDGPPGFLERLIQKGRSKHQTITPTSQAETKEQQHCIDMTEITNPNNVASPEFLYQPSDQIVSDVNSIYEEELNKKFGTTDVQSEVPRMSEKTPMLGKTAVSKEESKSFKEENKSFKEENKSFKEENKSFEEGSKSSEEVLAINQTIETKSKYVFPSIELLAKPKPGRAGMSDKDLKDTAMKLQKTLESFGVRVTITNISCGPSVTRYELQPEQGVKVSKITGLADDIKLNLAAADVRIEAPIPGKAAVGIEVPNKENSMVMLRELLETNEFKKHSSDIAFAVGKDIGGQAIVTDIARMPHLLIAGATGSGKSVCINTLIMSILYKANPADVRMIMVDPKVVELSVYNGIPHLLVPVVTDPKKASAALNWAVMEMTDRYKKFAEYGVRDLAGYNEKVKEVAHLNDPNFTKLPQIIIIVDELADLMMVAPGEVEDAICRLAQMARAAGLHLIIATQRPSVNVITGLIKANVPSRIAFSVSSSIDSRTIIDGSGAEKLLGKGDMLFFPSGYPKPVRVQGAFVSDKEVSAVVDFLKSQNHEINYSEEVNTKISNAQAQVGTSASNSANERDEYFMEAGKFIIEKDKASIGMLQRVYKIGFNRAARIMEQLAEAGVVGSEDGTKPRKILMSMEEFEQYIDEYV